MGIHPLAVVSPKATLGEGVEVGPFAYIADNAELGSGCVVMSHATVLGGTRLGAECVVHQGAVIGGDPQDRKFGGQQTFLEIGPRTIMREYVTISRATKDGQATRIGSDCMLMTSCHVGHDCYIGNHVTIANAVAIGGHVEIHDRATIGGLSAIHQFVHIGTMAMVGGDSGLNQDAPPFMITSGPVPAVVFGLNSIGLQRNGISASTRQHLKTAFRYLYRSQLTMREAVEQIKTTLPLEPEIAELLKFIATSRRGLSGGSQQRHAGSGAGSVSVTAGEASTQDSQSEPAARVVVS
ncbi:MAG: Acyl-[acyl-carrier-protein]--UDP-N-acetylglucosamine O-acyltransferase [bacterium]|nr:Acyl-[acyl-carrier-protein]--UDP-N-acetylglucosamine O-acyltransferase [bacterium]